MSPEPSSEPAFVDALRQATRGKRASGVEVLVAEKPPLLDGTTMRALVALPMAAFMVGAAVLRTRLTADVPFDLMALLLRAAALAFVVRALIATGVAWRARLTQVRAAGHVLAFDEAGIYERRAQDERWLARADVRAVVLEDTPERSVMAPRRRLWLVATPANGKVRHWQLDAHYAQTPDIVAARLSRWLLAPQPPQPLPRVHDQRSLETRYADAANGKVEAGDVCVPEGTGFRVRAPYAALLGVAFALDALWSAGPLRARILSPALLSCVLALSLLVGWFVWMGRRRATRLGLAMLITPAELLVRGKGGVVGVPWSQLSSAQVSTRLAWSPFYGSFAVRTLLITTTHGEALAFDAGFLGVPAEVLAALLDTLRAPPV